MTFYKQLLMKNVLDEAIKSLILEKSNLSPFFTSLSSSVLDKSCTVETTKSVFLLQFGFLPIDFWMWKILPIVPREIVEICFVFFRLPRFPGYNLNHQPE